MTERLEYGITAKLLHWLIVALMLAQFPLGWLMPDIRRGMTPDAAMYMHVMLGMITLLLIVIRLAWRVTHPVAPESSLPPWQRISSEAVHWLLYLLVLATTLTGWTYASMRGWTFTFFGAVPLPSLVAEGSSIGRTIGQLHEPLTFVLLVVVALHVLAALVHLFVYRDGVMQRMLPR